MGFLHNAFELGLLAVLLCVFKLIERRLTSGRAMQSPLRCDLGSVSAGARMMQPNLAPTDVSLIECRTVVSVVDLAPADGHARLWYTGAADLAPTDVSLIDCRTVVNLAPAYISRRARMNLIG